MKRYIYEQKFSDAELIDDNDLSQLYLTQPDVINPAINAIISAQDRSMNLISRMIETRTPEEINGYVYDINIELDIEKLIPLAENVSNTKAGIGFSTFTVTFEEKYFARGYQIMAVGTDYKVRLMIVEEPKLNAANLWEYTVRLMGTGDSADYVPASRLVKGTQFVRTYYVAAPYNSDGSVEGISGPARIRGNISFLRRSYGWSGNVANRQLAVKYDANEAPMAWDYIEYQQEIKWIRDKDTHYLHSKSNMASNGEFYQTDKDGNKVIEGDGLYEQCGIKDTFSEMSVTKLNTIIRDIQATMPSDVMNKNIRIITGNGGCDDFDRGIKNDLINLGYSIVTSDDKFIGQTSGGLRYGGYFIEYRHVDGFTVTVERADICDYGRIAKAAPRHPRTGLSLESHRMLILDDSNYNGVPNIVPVVEKGRSFERTVTLGHTKIPKNLPRTQVRSHSKDQGQVDFSQSAGVLIRVPFTCADLQCVAS